MGTTGRRRSVALRCAAATAACLLWGAPPAQAAATATATAATAVTSASWGVVVSTATQGPYPAGSTAAISGSLYADRYVTVVGTGTRPAGSVTYLYSGNALLVNAFLCPTPWTTATAQCAGGAGTMVALNAPLSGPTAVPAPGGFLYLKVNFLAGGSGVLQAQAARPTPLTTNA